MDPRCARSEADRGAVLPVHWRDQKRGQCQADGWKSAAVCNYSANGTCLPRWIERGNGGRDPRIQPEARALGSGGTWGVTSGRGGDYRQNFGRGERTVAHNRILREEPRCSRRAGEADGSNKRLESSRHRRLGYVLPFRS